jgi:hypothetical protein
MTVHDDLINADQIEQIVENGNRTIAILKGAAVWICRTASQSLRASFVRSSALPTTEG